MANIKSQKKRIRTAEIARVRNKAVRSELKTLIKHVRAAVEAGDKAAASAAATRARQGRGQGRHPQEPGRQPQVRRAAPGQHHGVALASANCFVEPRFPFGSGAFFMPMPRSGYGRAVPVGSEPRSPGSAVGALPVSRGRGADTGR